MRIINLSASAFGGLKEWQAAGLPPGLTVFLGNNEAGKSTLFNLIATLFFGWRPVKDNPYIPWDGGVPSISGLVLTDNGDELEIHRRLRSQAEGVLLRGNNSSNLRNNFLPQIFIPREIFEEIYALTLDKMRFPDDSAWQKLQDQLLGGQYGSFLRPVSSVINELEGEASNLWRPDRRGKPRSAELEKAIRQVRQQKKEVRENERELYALEVKLDELVHRREQLTEEKIQYASILLRCDRLNPVRKQWRRLLELKQQSEGIEDYSILPEHPQEEISRLEAEIDSLEHNKTELQKKKHEAEEKEKKFNDIDRKIISLQDIILGITQRYGQIKGYQEQSRQLEAQLMSNSSRLEHKAGECLRGGWSPQADRALQLIDEVELRAGINAFRKHDDELRRASARWEGLRAGASGVKLSRITPAVSILLFCAGMLGVWQGGNSALGISAGVTGAFGVGLFVIWLVTRNNGSSEAGIKEAGARIAELEGLCRDDSTRVKEALRGLPAAEQRLEKPDETLLLDVKDLKSLVLNRQELEQAKSSVTESLAEIAAAVEEHFDDFRLARAQGVLENINLLQRRLDEAEQRSQAAETARSAKEDVIESIKKLDAALQQNQTELEKILDGLNSLPGDNREENIGILYYRRKCRRQADSLEEELYHQHPDLEQILAEISAAETGGETWVYSEEEKIRAQEELNKINDELNQISTQVGTVQENIKNRQQYPRLDMLEGELDFLKGETETVARKRDRMELLRSLMIEADRRFREEHQPDVLQKAGDYLKIITGGRYRKIFVEEEGNNLLVESSYTADPLKVAHPLSRGTMEQVYLALRLALVKHLDSDRERLPLFLDEVLINWDSSRLERGLQLLTEITADRQVFLFTCHPWLAEKLREECRVINL